MPRKDDQNIPSCLRTACSQPMTTRVFTSFWLIVGEVSLPGWLPSGKGHLYGGSGEPKNFMFDLWNDNLVLKGGSELEITQIVPKSWWQSYFQGTHLVSFCLSSHGVRTIQTRSGSPHLDLQKKTSKFEQSGIVELPSWFVARSVKRHASTALRLWRWRHLS